MTLNAEKAREITNNYDKNKSKNNWYCKMLKTVYSFFRNIHINIKVRNIEHIIKGYAKSGDSSVHIEKHGTWIPYEEDIIKKLEKQGYTVKTSISKNCFINESDLAYDSLFRGYDYCYYNYRHLNFYINWEDVS